MKRDLAARIQSHIVYLERSVGGAETSRRNRTFHLHMRSEGTILKRSNTTDRPMRCRPTRYGLYMNYADVVGTDTWQVVPARHHRERLPSI